MPVAPHIRDTMSSSSFIRKMFEEGIQLKARLSRKQSAKMRHCMISASAIPILSLPRRSKKCSENSLFLLKKDFTAICRTPGIRQPVPPWQPR